MKIKSGLLLFLLLITAAIELQGARERYVRFENISLAHGLSQILVNAITQDAQGFMWFGTQDGLNRYDGYNFEIFKYNPTIPGSLADNHIRSLFTDKNGTLWIGTYSGGLDKFDSQKETFIHYRHDPSDPASLSNNEVRAIFQDLAGELWIGTWGGGLNKFNREEQNFTRYRHDAEDPSSISHNMIRDICEDNKGMLWVGTYGGGLNRMNRETGDFRHFMHQRDNPDSLSINYINCICETRAGVLWIGTDGGGLDRWNPGKETFTHFRHEPNNPYSLNHNIVTFIHEDKDGWLWIGTDGGGVDIYDPLNDIFTHHTHEKENVNSLNHDRAVTIYNDDTEMLWLGTHGGINIYDPERLRFYHFTNPTDSLNQRDIRAIYESRNGYIWIGTYGAGLARYNRHTGTYKYYTHNALKAFGLSDNHVFAILEDGKGIIWVGTMRGGLNAFNTKTGKFKNFRHDAHIPESLSHDRVRCLYEDSLGRLWVGTQGGGLNRFSRNTQTFTHYHHNPTQACGLSNNRVFAIRESHDGRLWLGTFGGGLNRFDPSTENFECFRHQPENPNSLSNNRVTCLHEDKKGILWAGTDGGGLSRFDPRKNLWKRYLHEDGLPNNVVCGILEDNKGNLWLSTNKGLSKYNPVTETFFNYGEKDGLQNIEFNLSAFHQSSRTGEMFFGGINGINSFFPSTIRPNPNIHPVVLTGFRKFNKEIHLGKAISRIEEIQLSHADNFFSFEFVSPEYRNPGKNLYAYRLDGFDREWIPSGTRRYANYTNVPAGGYVFKVKSWNQEGGESETSVKIRVAPPFWQKWWFFILGPAALFLLVFTFNQIKTSTIRKKNRQLEELITQLNQEVSDRKQTELMQSILYQIAEKALSEVDFDELYRFIHESISRLMDAGNFYIALHNAEENVINLPYFVDEVDDYQGKTIKASRGLTEYVITKGKSLLVTDGECEEMMANGEVELVGSPSQIWLGVPLKFKNEILGAMVVQHYSNPKAYTEKDRAMLEFVSGQITAVIHRKRQEAEKIALKEKLVLSEKMEAIGRLAGGVAHDLNNVLSAIVSYPELLLMKLPKDSPHRKPLTAMHQSGQRAAAIVQDLLTLARRSVDVKEVLNWNDIITKHLATPEFARFRGRYPGVELEVRLDEELLNIEGSPVHLGKALLNLCYNAAEASPGGGVITITTSNLFQEKAFKKFDIGNYVVLTITDTGVGIARKDIKRIFEPFYTRKEMGLSGTGLGMAVVWNTVSDHNGYLNVNSKEGEGTTFELYFPVTDKELPEEKKITGIDEYMGKGESIMVVDDVDEQREIVTVLLAELNYEAHTVASGEEAVEYIKDHRVDLVILDMIMDPGMDGLDTYISLRELQPDIKAIIASGFSETQRVRQALKLGVGAYVKKPYTLERFGEAIKKELRKS